MKGYRWFRYTAFVLLVGIVAVSGIAVGGAVINIGQGIYSKNVKSIDSLKDRDTLWQWAPESLISTPIEAYQSAVYYELRIAYHPISSLFNFDAHPQKLSDGTGGRVTRIDRSSSNVGDFPNAANQLHIKF